MPNLEVKCSKEMESFFLENDGELLRKLHALLKDHKSLDPVTEEPKNTVLRGRVATTLTPWTFCIVGDEEGPSKRVSVNFALGDKPDRKGPLGDRLRKDLGLDLEDVIVDHLSGKYKMEEGREYTMVSETREVNRHHYNDKPRKKVPARPKNIEPNSNPDKPAFEMPPGAINTHCHVNSNGMTPFPWSDDRKYDPAFAPWRKLEELDTFLGFSGEVIVAATCHGTDNSYMLNALKRAKGRALGVAFVDKNISDEELMGLDTAGVRGVRYSYVKRLTNPPPPEEMVAMANRLKRLREFGKLQNDWHIDLYCEAADLKDLESHIKAIPIPVVFDHMAVPAIDKGVSDPEFQRFLQLFRDKRSCYTKLTCPERLTGSSKPEDWSKVVPFARALAEEFPDHVITGTDWPHPNMKAGQMPNDGALLNRWIWEVAGRNNDILQRILVNNPRHLFSFPSSTMAK
ncbi:MAG TPA: amidohydrolase family protein [Bryobacteraceae bacterium]|nr:amidohydrolase family protein [Bryobacteraceae bacterium]